MSKVNLDSANIDVIDAMHSVALAMDGGLTGYRDKKALDSAVNRALMRQYYNPNADVFELITATGYALIQNHPYNDGNKRTGALFTLTALKQNGYEMNLPDSTLHHFFQSVAASEISEKDMADFLRKNTTKVQENSLLLQKAAKNLQRR